MSKSALISGLCVIALFTGPAAAQSNSDRVGAWAITKIAVYEGGNVCSALRTYGHGYAVEIVQAQGRSEQLILRLESPEITYRPGQMGEEIEPGENLMIFIGNAGGQEGGNAVVRQGPRGLGFVTTLIDTHDRFSPIRNLRSGQSISAYIAFPDGTEDKRIGTYSLAGSGAALDALARCVNQGSAAPPVALRPPAAASPRETAPAPRAESLPVPFGKYAENGHCANAHMMLTPSYWGDDSVGEGWAIGPFRNLGGNRWALSATITITVTGPRSFTVRGRSMTWCGA